MKWQSKPDQTGFERDYYRVDIAEVDPNAVETSLGQIEGQIAPIIQKTIHRHELPKGEDLQALIEFVALLALRTPLVRQLFERNMEHLYRGMLKFVLSQRERYDQIAEELRLKGEEPPSGITYEELRELANDEGAYEIEIPRTRSVQMLLKMWPALVPGFRARHWSLLFTRPDEAHFICSDMPVAITPTSPDFRPHFLGFGLPGTELTVPLSRSTVLVGSYERPAITAEVDLETVRHINQRTLSFTERFFYSSGQWVVS